MKRTLSLALAVVVFAGCDSIGPNPFLPEAIPSEAFALNAGVFPANTARVQAGDNYLNASARVGVVSAVIGANLVLPVAATDAVTQATPTVEEDGDWVWSSSVDVFGSAIGLRLEATPVAGEIGWQLDATEEGEAPFTAYTATTTLDGMTGAWSLFRPDETGPVLTATFDVLELQNREITFRVPAGRENGGSSVRYATDRTEQTFDWVQNPGNNRALIVWDAQTRAGSITADSYNGGARACWDDNLQDVDC